MRQPSINPPSFYDDVAPPPLFTPPPKYDDLTPRVEVRDGYFDMDSNESNSDENTDRAADGTSDIDNATDTSSIQLTEDVESEPELEPPVAPTPVDEEARVEESDDEDAGIEERDIVDMVGLEDLSLELRMSSPVGRRNSDFLHASGSIWVL